MAMSDGVLSLLTATLMDKIVHGEDVHHRQYFLNGGVPHYDTYRCADGRWISVACLETHFYANLCRALELDDFLDHQFHEDRYPALREALTERFAGRTRDEWVAALEAHDVCIAPVLEQDEITTHPHIRARGTITEVDSPGRPRDAGRRRAEAQRHARRARPAGSAARQAHRRHPARPRLRRCGHRRAA